RRAPGGSTTPPTPGVGQCEPGTDSRTSGPSRSPAAFPAAHDRSSGLRTPGLSTPGYRVTTRISQDGRTRSGGRSMGICLAHVLIPPYPALPTSPPRDPAAHPAPRAPSTPPAPPLLRLHPRPPAPPPHPPPSPRALPETQPLTRRPGPPPPPRLHHYFERTCDDRPGATALECDGETLSYQALDERANQLAHHLVAAGLRPGARVG